MTVVRGTRLEFADSSANPATAGYLQRNGADLKWHNGSTVITLGEGTVTAGSTNTFTNKTISGSGNTLSNIANGSLTNSSITVSDGSNTSPIALGGTLTFTATANETTIVESAGTVTIGLPDNITVGGILTVTGNLVVNGTTTTINTATLEVEDKNIEIAKVGTPSDTTADGAGITIKGASDKTILWDNANDNLTSNQDWNIVTGKSYKINNAVVLNATTLGTTVVGSSLTSVGTLTGLTIAGAVTLNATNELRLADTDSSHYVGFKSPASVTTNKVWTLPSADGTNGQTLETNGSGVLSWATAGGGFGSQQFWADGGAFIPTPSSTVGTASSYGQTRVLSNGVAVSSVVLPEHASIDSRCIFNWTPPKNWNNGTIKAKIYWTMEDTTTTSVGDTGAFEVSAIAISNDDTMNASFGTAIAVTDVFLATNDLHVTAITSAITVGGSPANADFVQIRVNRNAGSDTLESGSNVELLGIILEYTQDASTSRG